MQHDQTIWNRLRAGDKAALSQIYQEQVDALFRYGCQFTRDEGLVEDMIQDLFIELWKNHNSLGNTDAIRQYLLVALRRKIVRRLQQQQGRADHLVKVQTEDNVQAADAAILQKESIQEQQTKVASALQQLSERQREILYLKYFEELNYKQIAELLQINHQSVRNTASAGLKALRKRLGPAIGWLLWLISQGIDEYTFDLQCLML